MAYRRNEPSHREKWKTRVLKTSTISHGTRLFLVHTLAKHMKADGFVSHARWKLADEAGVSERQVTRYMSNAVDAGWLMVQQAGYRTMTAEYYATFPNHESGTQDVSLSTKGKRDANWLPLGVTNTSLIPAGKRDVGRPTTSSSTTRPLEVVRTDRNVSHLPRSPLSRRRAFGFGINESQRDRRTSCRTQARTVERHRRRPTAAQVETHPSGTWATTPLACQTQPRRKGLAMNQLPVHQTPCDSPGCTFGMTGLWMNLCARCGGSGYLQPGDTPTGADAARIAAGLAPKHATTQAAGEVRQG